jgi:signal recognition particle subunit SRP54
LFATLSDRLADTFKNLRGKGRLSEADIDATAREIRIALLEADVALPVVKEFTAAVKERARGEEVSQALNPAQQVVKIVNEELVEILGGETRRLRYAKTGPTVIMLAGLQGAGKTTLAGQARALAQGAGQDPAAGGRDLQRPNAVNQLQVNGERVGVPVFAPEPGNGVGDPVAGRGRLDRGGQAHPARRRHRRHRRPARHRRRDDAAGRGHPRRGQPDEVLFVVDAMIGQDAVTTAQAFLEGVGFDGVVLTKLDGDARGGAALSVARSPASRSCSPPTARS